MPLDPQKMADFSAKVAESNKRALERKMIDSMNRKDPEINTKRLGGMKKGGKVKKTGLYTLHKGEKVLTAKAARKPTAKPTRRRAARPKGRR